MKWNSIPTMLRNITSRKKVSRDKKKKKNSIIRIYIRLIKWKYHAEHNLLRIIVKLSQSKQLLIRVQLHFFFIL